MIAVIITVCVIVAAIPIGMAIYYVIETQKTNWFIFFNKKKQKGFIKENATAEQGQIVFIGDSIIDFYNVDKYLDGKGLKIYNRGISGDTSRNLLDRLESNALSIKPSVLFLLVGTNDIDKGISHDETIKYITEILTKVKENGVKHIYVESVYPVNASVDKAMVDIRTNDMIDTLNVRLKTLAEDMGVTYVNIHDSLLDGNGAFDKQYTKDGLHPNAKGYEVVTSIVQPCIDDSLC